MLRTWLEFLTALLAFLAVLTPTVRSVWRQAKARGRHRWLLLLVATFINLVAYIIGVLGLFFEWHPYLTLGCLLISGALFVLTFLWDPNGPVITRADIVMLLLGFVGSLGLTFAELNLIERKFAEAKAKAAARASPSPLPSSSPSPSATPQ